MRNVLFLTLLSCLVPSAFASAALLYIDPGVQSYGVGDTFVADVRVDNEDECVNAASVEIIYPTRSLRAVDFSRGDSIFTLWTEDPTIDTEAGRVTFSGGVPGGYCGRIQGDPALSNIVGKIVFTVIDATAKKADIIAMDTTRVYLHDGLGTEASLRLQSATIGLLDDPTLSGNEWLSEVKDDRTPPDAFTIDVESTRGVFGGRYYAVFSTVDKQSGLSHYEVFERGAWVQTRSPHRLYDQSLSNIQIRAIDKAGNVRMGEYVPGSAPMRVGLDLDFSSVALAFFALAVIGGVFVWFERRHNSATAPPSQA